MIKTSIKEIRNTIREELLAKKKLVNENFNDTDEVLFCKNCDEEIVESGDDNVPYVHVFGGNQFCDVHNIDDVFANKNNPNRPIATPNNGMLDNVMDSIHETNQIKNIIGQVLNEWSSYHDNKISSYQQALELLNSGRNKTNKKIATNTFLILNPEDQSISVKLHDTDIVKYYKNGIIELNSGGWRSMTTKDRLQAYSPADISNEKNQWYIQGQLFYDGIKIDSQGNLKTTKKGMAGANKNVNMELKVRQYTEGFINALKNGEVPVPSAGDCWTCSMGIGSGADHLLQHMKEKYYVPSLLINAIKKYQGEGWLNYFGRDIFQSKGNPNPTRDMSHIYSTAKKCLNKYILNELAIKKS